MGRPCPVAEPSIWRPRLLGTRCTGRGRTKIARVTLRVLVFLSALFSALLCMLVPGPDGLLGFASSSYVASQCSRPGCCCPLMLRALPLCFLRCYVVPCGSILWKRIRILVHRLQLHCCIIISGFAFACRKQRRRRCKFIIHYHRHHNVMRKLGLYLVYLA